MTLNSWQLTLTTQPAVRKMLHTPVTMGEIFYVLSQFNHPTYPGHEWWCAHFTDEDLRLRKEGWFGPSPDRAA